MSSDEVFCYRNAVVFLKFSGRKPNSANVYRTIRRFVEDEVYRKKVINSVCVQLVFLQLCICYVQEMIKYLNLLLCMIKDRKK